jgi:uncharacterized membrane protein YoaK (UPF0700 family)
MTADLPERRAALMPARALEPKALGVVWLSFASGATDVLSFLDFGEVFTSAMTGNTALLGIAIARGQLLAASRSLTALFGFALGVMLAQALRDRGGAAQDPRPILRRLLLVEITCLGVSAALFGASRALLLGDVLYLVILLSAVSMGIQGVAARVIGYTGISTIVFTSVLISIVSSWTAAIARRGKEAAPPAGIRPHLGAFAAYALGALLAGLLSIAGPTFLVWLPIVAVALALASSYLRQQRERSAG